MTAVFCHNAADRKAETWAKQLEPVEHLEFAISDAAKGIAAAMDVDGPVTSPTYVLARVHPPRRAGAPAMIHVYVYRLLDHQGADLLGELDSLDLDTDLQDAVVVVEWGEGLAERLAERHLDIRLERVSYSDVRIATWEWGHS